MFHNRIAYWADVKGLKHKHLAKKCDVSIQTFSRWVNNHKQPDLKHSFILARLFEITVDELGVFEGEKESGESDK